MKKEKVSHERKQLIRLAGEFIVASELCRKGYFVSPQLGITRKYDLIVYDNSGGLAYIEVKSSFLRGWILGKKKENEYSEKHFFALVSYFDKEGQMPDIYIIPANVVLMELKKTGQLNIELSLCQTGKFRKYKNNFDILNLKPTLK